MALNFLNNATFTGSVTVQGDGIDIDNDDNVRLRFDNLSTFEAGLQVATTSGDMIAGSAINDFAIRSQGNMLFASGGNTERMRIDTIGNVGIGTDNPGALLHVKAATNVTGTIEVQGGKAQVTAAGEINAELNFGSNDGSATGGIGGSIKSVTENTNGAYVGMSFYTAKQGRTPVLKEAMRIDKDGFVGIGTTSPDRLLDLEGDLAVIKLNTTSATADTFIDFETEGINRFRVGYDKSDDAFKIAKTNNNSNNFTVNYGTGNVGIGSNSPVGKLYVGPTWDTSAGGNTLYIKNPSTDNDSYDPQVEATTDLGITMVRDSATTTGPDTVGLTLYNDDGTAGGFSPMLLFSKLETPTSQFKASMAGIYARSPLGTGDSGSWIDGELIFATAGAASQGIKQRMVINKEGSVGINKISPDFKLDVSGTLGVSDLPLNSTSVSVLVANETIGTELVTNGDFAADTSWTYTASRWSISGGKANFNASSGNTGVLYQGFTLTNAVVYRVVFNVSGSSGSGANIWIGNAGGSINYLGGTYKLYADGFFEEIFTMPSTQTSFAFYSNSTGSSYSLDNVSLKQVISASDQIQKRELSSDAFGPGNGPYLPLTAGSSSPLTGDLFINKTNPGIKLRAGTQDVAWLGDFGGGTDGQLILFDNAGAVQVALNGQANSYLNGGNVGIGTTSPDDRLDVVDGNAQMVFGTASSDRTFIQFKHNAVPVDGEELCLMDFSGYNSASQDTRYVILTTKAEDVTDGSEDGSLTFSTMKGGTATQTLTVRSGNVGIGTTSPRGKLDVVGNTDTDSDFLTIQDNDTSAGSHRPSIRFRSNTAQIGQIAGLNGSMRFSSGTSESSMIEILDNGNVGINTTNPQVKLQVDGGIRALGTTSSTGQIDASPDFGAFRFYNGSTFRGGLGTGQWAGNTGANNTDIVQYLNNVNYYISNTSTPLLKVDINGNVGIGTGTSSPTSKLMIETGAEEGIRIYRAATNANFGAIEFRNSDDTATNSRLGFGTNYMRIEGTNNLQFVTNSAEAMRILSGGNVGINTTNPAAKLEVKAIGLGPFTGDQLNQVIFQGDRHDWIFEQIRTGNATDWNSTTLRLQTRIDSTDLQSIDFVTDSSYLRHIDINTNANTFNTRFTHGGDVGIGTQGPAAKLHVQGQDAVFYSGTSTQSMQIGRGSSERIEIFVNDLENKITAYQDADGNNDHTFILDRVYSGTGGNNFQIRKSGSAQLTINKDGNVGIGVTVPTSTLTVKGTSSNGINVQGVGTTATRCFMGLNGSNHGEISVAGSSGQGSSKITSVGSSYLMGGNVGINDATPGYKLDVNGTIRATGDVIAFSDARVKDNVVTIDNALDKVNKLRGVTYTRNDIEDKQTKMGVIAQEVLEVIPEVVQQDNEGKYSVAYGNMNGLLIEAIKELKAEIEELKSRL